MRSMGGGATQHPGGKGLVVRGNIRGRGVASPSSGACRRLTRISGPIEAAACPSGVCGDPTARLAAESAGRGPGAGRFFPEARIARTGRVGRRAQREPAWRTDRHGTPTRWAGRWCGGPCRGRSASRARTLGNEGIEACAGRGWGSIARVGRRSGFAERRTRGSWILERLSERLGWGRSRRRRPEPPLRGAP